MNIRFSLLLLLLLSIVNCSDSGLVRSVMPVDRSNVQIIKNRAGLIRTLYCDVLVENVNRDNWSRLSGFPEFEGKGRGFPVETCFQITVYNTWEKPFEVESVRLKSGDKSIKPEYYRDIADASFSAERYSVNLRNLWKSRRILSRAELVGDINYDSDTIEYDLEFIAPGDRVARFYMFSHHSEIGEKFTISMVIKYLNMKKVIDFDMVRLEHRDQLENTDEYEF